MSKHTGPSSNLSAQLEYYKRRGVLKFLDAAFSGERNTVTAMLSSPEFLRKLRKTAKDKGLAFLMAAMMLAGDQLHRDIIVDITMFIEKEYIPQMSESERNQKKKEMSELLDGIKAPQFYDVENKAIESSIENDRNSGNKLEKLFKHHSDLHGNKNYTENMRALHDDAERGNWSRYLKLYREQPEPKDINPVNPDGFSSLHIAAKNGHVLMVKKILMHLVKQGKNVSDNNGYLSPLLIAREDKQAELASIYIKIWRKKLYALQGNAITNHLKDLKNEWIDFFTVLQDINNEAEIKVLLEELLGSLPDEYNQLKINCFIEALAFLARVKNTAIADVLISISSKYIETKTIIGWIDTAKKYFDNTPPSNAFFNGRQRVLLNIKTGLNKLIIAKKRELKCLLKDKRWSQAISGGKISLQDMQTIYDTVDRQITSGIYLLEKQPTEALVESNFENLQNSLSKVISGYTMQKTAFLSEQEKLKQPLQQSLIPYKEACQSKHKLIQEIQALLGHSRSSDATELRQYQSVLEKSIVRCQSAIQQSEYGLSPTLEKTSQELEMSAQLLQNAVEEYKKEQQTREEQRQTQGIAQKIDKALLILERKREKNTTRINMALAKIKALATLGMQDTWTRLESKLYSLQEALNTQQKEIETLSATLETEDLLRKLNVTMEEDSLHYKILNIQMQIEDGQIQREKMLSQEREGLAKQIKERVATAQKALSAIIHHSFFKKVMHNKISDVYEHCLYFSHQGDTLEKYTNFSICENIQAHYEAVVDYQQRLSAIDTWLSTHVADMESLKETLDQHLAIDKEKAVVVAHSPLPAKVEPEEEKPLLPKRNLAPSRDFTLGAQMVHIPLAMACGKEITQLNTLLQILPHDNSNSVKKSNALLLSIAQLLEGMKQARDRQLEVVLPPIAVIIRDKIFHTLHSGGITENQYERLFKFAGELAAAVRCNTNLDPLLGEFYAIFPETPDDSGTQRIRGHIQYLQSYRMAIRNGEMALTDDKVAQWDIALQLAQLSALLSKTPPEDSIRQEIRAFMRENELRACANSIRHQGPEAVVPALENFYLGVVSDQQPAMPMLMRSMQALRLDDSALGEEGKGFQYCVKRPW